MAVYVDAAMIPYRGMKMSHMMADVPEELLGMAERIGVSPRHLQFPGTPKEHFDICATKRRAAITHGAIPVTSRDIVMRMRRKSRNPLS